MIDPVGHRWTVSTVRVATKRPAVRKSKASDVMSTTDEGGDVNETDNLLITTCETIPGYVTEKVLGMVDASGFGVAVVRNRVIRKAQRLGANALLGARYSGGSGSGFAGSVFYGTAVVVRPEVRSVTADA